MPEDKTALSIILTEPAVFLRGADTAARRSSHGQGGSNEQSVPLRGLLSLNIARPTRISSIEVELICKTTTTWPEGMGARRIDVVEDHTLYQATATFFEAKSDPIVSTRRTVSSGPGLLLDDESSPRGRSTRPRSPLRRHTSQDRTNFYRNPVEVRYQSGSQPPTPPYTPSAEPLGSPLIRPASPSGYTPPTHLADEDPLQVLEHSRNALLADLQRENSVIPPSVRRRSMTQYTPITSSNSSVRSREGPSPRVSSDEDVTATTRISPNRTILHTPPMTSPPQPSVHYGPSPSYFPTSPVPPPGRNQTPSVDADERGRRGKSSKSRTRFSLASVVGVFRSRSRRDTSPEPGNEGPRRRFFSPSRERGEPERGRTGQRPSNTATATIDEDEEMPHRRSAIGRVLGLENSNEGHEHRDHGQGWKEFKKGTYTYPILFSVPASCPASLVATHGSVSWKLRAAVHRPGAFSPAFRAEKPVHVVAAPGEADTEESESVVVERSWDGQLQYVLSVSGKSFAIGGTIPLQLVFMPLDKVKIHRIAVFLDEKIEYMTSMNRVVRSDPLRRYPLLNLRDEHDHHLLPLDSSSPDALLNSPLAELFPVTSIVDSEGLTPEDQLLLSNTASMLMGPGPWSLESYLTIPTCSSLRPTSKNKRANVLVTHALRVVLRVERGDDAALDAKTGKRKLFDIVLHTPIHLLSCLCAPDQSVLPLYGALEALPRTLPDGHLCTCEPSDDQDLFHKRPGFKKGRSNTPAIDPLTAQTAQYNRLVSGTEAESGERPPAYREVLAGNA